MATIDRLSTSMGRKLIRESSDGITDRYRVERNPGIEAAADLALISAALYFNSLVPGYETFPLPEIELMDSIEIPSGATESDSYTAGTYKGGDTCIRVMEPDDVPHELFHYYQHRLDSLERINLEIGSSRLARKDKELLARSFIESGAYLFDAAWVKDLDGRATLGALEWHGPNGMRLVRECRAAMQGRLSNEETCNGIHSHITKVWLTYAPDRYDTDSLTVAQIGKSIAALTLAATGYDVAKATRILLSWPSRAMQAIADADKTSMDVVLQVLDGEADSLEESLAKRKALARKDQEGTPPQSF